MFNKKEEEQRPATDVQKQAFQMFDELATKLDDMDLYEFCKAFKDYFIKYRECQLKEIETKGQMLAETLTAFKDK